MTHPAPRALHHRAIVALDNGRCSLDQISVEIFAALGLTDHQPRDFKQLGLELAEAIEALCLFLLREAGQRPHLGQQRAVAGYISYPANSFS